MSRRLRWRMVLALVAGMGASALALPTGALALSGKPVLVGTSDNSAAPAVVVDASGTAYVAWTIPTTGDETDPDLVGFCMIEVGKSSCSGGGVLSAGPGNPAIGSVQLAIDGPAVILVADQFTDSDDEADNYVDEWATLDGSANFTAVDGGESVSTGNGYGGDSLFTLPGAGTSGGPLGYGYSSIGDSGGSYYTSVINPFNAPPTCSEATEDAAGTSTCAQTPLATMSAPGDGSSQAPNDYASNPGPDPGVLGVFHTLFSSDCHSDTAGLSFLYGSGNQSATNSYGISAGSAGSAWHGGATIFDCNADTGVPVSGTDGFGALTDDATTTDVLNYRPFNQAGDGFGPAVSVDASEGATVSDLAAGEAANGGIFTTYENGNTVYKGPNDLSYSPDGGKIWDGPVALTNLSQPLAQSVSSVGPGGQGWLVWVVANGNGTDADENVDVQQFDQQDVPPDHTKLTTRQSRGAKSGANLVLAHGLTGESDRATLTGVNARYATGKVSYTLLAGSCKPGLTLATYHEGTATVSNGVIASSKKVTEILAPGKYYWQAKYTGDRNNAAVTSTCPNAVLTVEKPRT